ncbi:hypothetical protein GQ55_9G557800 [Panicum hallii var. hallii]|uniref:Uncharacterized protein n=1 Tax=Panicum hallii var. hallii TaxID=1504633 RepID=A0A2T7CFT7_9POAL|nr:hypothetical protein GQ55_9G557800 [Panicum hallii var. hallii]
MSFLTRGVQDVSPDDFSGSEAEDRLKSLQNNTMESPPVAEDENEPGPIVDNPPEPSEVPPVAEHMETSRDPSSTTPRSHLTHRRRQTRGARRAARFVGGCASRWCRIGHHS